MTDRVLRSAFGLTFSKSYVFDRVLEVAALLCWNPEDIGLTTVHLLGDTLYRSRKKAEVQAKELGAAAQDIRTLFQWVEPVGERSGIQREAFLQNEYWPSREQTTNILFDSVLQTHIEYVRPLLADLLHLDLGSLAFIQSKTTNKVRKYTGQPDTVLLDDVGKNIIFLEIKIAGTKTKYTLDQHFKYLTLNALVSTNDFFPDYRIHNVILAPRNEFAANTRGLGSLAPVCRSDGQILFDYSGVDVSQVRPTGEKDVNTLIDSRLAAIRGSDKADLINVTEGHRFTFISWSSLLDAIRSEPLKDSLEPLRPFLVGD